LKAHTITWDGCVPGIENSLNETFAVGDPRDVHTVISIHPALQKKERLSDVAVRTATAPHFRTARVWQKASCVLVPWSGLDDRAIVLASFCPRTERGRLEWQPLGGTSWLPWRYRRGILDNGQSLWSGAYQYAYGERLNRDRQLIVRRLLTLHPWKGFSVRRGNHVIHFQWDGTHIKRSEFPQIRTARTTRPRATLQLGSA
jgi:hypothetical protein